ALQRGQPLDAPAIAGAVGGDITGAPVLRRRPGDDLRPVRAVVAVRLEGAVGVPAPAHVHHRAGVPDLGEHRGALGIPLSRLAVRGAYHHGGRGQRPGQRQVGRQRDAVAQRDPDIEPARNTSLDHDPGCYRWRRFGWLDRCAEASRTVDMAMDTTNLAGVYNSPLLD